MGRIIQRDKSIIPACDVPFDIFKRLVKSTGNIGTVGAYKVGVSFLDVGLSEVVRVARDHTQKPIIYDHQKAGTDIHESTPDQFMDAMVRAKVNAVILFPQAGPVTEYEWIKAAQERELGVIVGGEMTQPRYLDGDLSNGKKKDYTKIFKELGIERELPGFIRSTAPRDMYELAARMGVRDFVVPGNKPDRIKTYKEFIEGWGITDASFYSPGLIDQGGNISEGAKAAGNRWHAILGRGSYYNKEQQRFNTELEMKEAAIKNSAQLN